MRWVDKGALPAHAFTDARRDRDFVMGAAGEEDQQSDLLLLPDNKLVQHTSALGTRSKGTSLEAKLQLPQLVQQQHVPFAAREVTNASIVLTMFPGTKFAAF